MEQSHTTPFSQFVSHKEYLNNPLGLTLSTPGLFFFYIFYQIEPILLDSWQQIDKNLKLFETPFHVQFIHFLSDKAKKVWCPWQAGNTD